jgi:Ran GTPase-activating protein (RanGAP) involved in mRNA processing and transport
LQKNLHVLKVKGDRIRLEEIMTDHAREMEAEHVEELKRMFDVRGLMFDVKQ